MSKVKPIKRKIERIIQFVQTTGLDDQNTYDTVYSMVNSLVKGRDTRIKELEKRVRPFFQILTIRRISGAVRCTIRDLGDIDATKIDSAAKRILGTLKKEIKIKGISRWKLIIQYAMWLYGKGKDAPKY